MLYQMDVSGADAEHTIRLFWSSLSTSGGGSSDDARDDSAAKQELQELTREREFADALVRGYDERKTEIDDKIRSVSRHWRLERMARVDRNIIRLGAYELLHMKDVPRRVTLNEAVELAKRFGNEESPAFVNGVLDRIGEDSAKE